MRHPRKVHVSEVLRILTSLRRYAVVGAIATGVDWILFSVFVFAMDWHYVVAGIVSFVVATFAGYISGLRLLFRGGRYRRWIEISFIYLVSILGLVIHLAVLMSIVGWLQMHVLLGKVAATAAAFLWNFATRYFWIFDREALNA